MDTGREQLPYLVGNSPSVTLYGHWDTPLVREYNCRAREYCVITLINIWTILTVFQFIRSDWTTCSIIKTNGVQSWTILNTNRPNLKSSCCIWPMLIKKIGPLENLLDHDTNNNKCLHFMWPYSYIPGFSEPVLRRLINSIMSLSTLHDSKHFLTSSRCYNCRKIVTS